MRRHTAYGCITSVRKRSHGTKKWTGHPRQRDQNGQTSRLRQLLPGASSLGHRISSSYLRAAAGHEKGLAGEWGEVHHAPEVLQGATLERRSTSSCTIEATWAEWHARLSSRPRAAARLLDWSCARTCDFTSSVSSSLDLQGSACKTSTRSRGSPLWRRAVAHSA